MPNWSKIDTVLLDMDGTLLDLHFDTHFWLQVVPCEYAKKNSLSIADARAEIASRYHAVQGQIQWYCLDYWQQQLDLPILALKQQTKHLIAMRDDTKPFLNALKQSDKRVILLTNASRDNLALKLERTSLEQYLDQLISTHDYGISKEQQGLWQKVQSDVGFENERTLFVDDSAPVLAAAQRFGVGHLLAVANPNSQQPAKAIDGYENITDFRTILPI